MKTMTAIVDMYSAKAFRVEIVGVEHDGYLVREVGTKRVDWFQKDRVWLDR
jgi:hypothetical protein